MLAATTLVIETSTPLGSLALFFDGTCLAESSFGSDRSHNTGIFAPLEAILRKNPTLSIDQILVGSGPGSYSGTRVGIAAAQGTAIIHHCPAIALPSILAIPSADHGATALVIGDARRGTFWTAEISDHQLRADPTLTDAAGLATIFRRAITAGHAVVAFEEPTRFPLGPELQASIRVESPDARRLFTAWQHTPEEIKSRWQAESPAPLYLKPPHITAPKRPPLVP